ncbi:MAG: hypothetical protein ACTSRA_05290 [Promethearchaeota archaeon]
MERSGKPATWGSGELQNAPKNASADNPMRRRGGICPRARIVTTNACPDVSALK